jgi:hypothetical protein
MTTPSRIDCTIGWVGDRFCGVYKPIGGCMELTPEERRRIYEEEAARLREEEADEDKPIRRRRIYEEDKPVLVERTGKKIKVWYIIGWLLVIGGASRSCGEISPTGNLYCYPDRRETGTVVEAWIETRQGLPLRREAEHRWRGQP